MCDRDRSAAIIKVNGFDSAFSLAHQIGHRYVNYDKIQMTGYRGKISSCVSRVGSCKDGGEINSHLKLFLMTSM